jgi:hypothetical protein
VRRAAAAAALAALACSSSPERIPLEEIARGLESGVRVAGQRRFRGPQELEGFARTIRGRGAFPERLADVDWSKHEILAAFAGEVASSEDVAFLEATRLGSAIVVGVARIRHELPDLDALSIAPTHTPYVLATIPRTSSPIRFLARHAPLE